MTFDDYIKTFAGYPIHEYEHGTPIPGGDVAVRVDVSRQNDDGSEGAAEDYEKFFENEGLENVKALVFGCWTFYGEGDVSMIVDPLIKSASKLPNLKALFIGDAIYEDCEVSWLIMADISKLWKAFPQLEVFWIRGSDGLSLGEIQNENLKELVLQSGGLPQTVVGDVFRSKLPNLEHLELWLGDFGYGGDTDIESIEPIFTGELFPKLKYLGLKNSQYTDDIAKAIVDSPILARLEVLDLSEGTLSDEGAEALLASREKFAHLKKLDLHHHFMSNEMMKRMREMPCETDVSGQIQEKFYGRYVSVSE